MQNLTLTWKLLLLLFLPLAASSYFLMQAVSDARTQQRSVDLLADQFQQLERVIAVMNQVEEEAVWQPGSRPVEAGTSRLSMIRLLQQPICQWNN